MALFLLAGCKEEAVRQEFSEPVYSAQYRQASTTVIVSLSATNIASSGQIRMMIDVHAPEGSDVVVPELGGLVVPFSVGDGYSEPVQFLPNGKLLHRRVWILLPGLPGETVFQPVEIQVGSDAVKTKAVNVSVSSLLPAGIEKPEIKDIVAPVELLPEEKKRQQIKYILLAFSGSVAFLALVLHWMSRPKRRVVLAPDEAALQALGTLPEDALARIDETRRILIEYLERQFEIRTAGKTTGEIIRNIPKYPLLGRRIRLVNELTTNDLIRFSNRIPERYTEEFADYVRWFVEETTEALCE